MVFNPLAMDSELGALVKEYAEAYALLTAGDPQAVRRLALLRSRYPNDPLVDYHWQRVQTGELSTRVKLVSK